MKDSDKRATLPDKKEEFFKPYRIKPAEVYVEPNENICLREDKFPR